MKMQVLMAALGASCSLLVNAAAPSDPKLVAAIAASTRAPENRARDPHRHPLETLTFFGIRPDMTVVELWPGGGWYTEILAPYLADGGKLYVAAPAPAAGAQSSLDTKLKSRPAEFGKVERTVLSRGSFEIAPAGSADMVLTFRNIHNWVGQGIAKDVFAAAFRALKPGGTLGVTEHRDTNPGEDGSSKSGYMGEDYSIRLIESAGFRLVDKSDVNNNPKDTKDYPKGVWTLPPNYTEGDKDRAKYAAIGESDRFTLKFVKPATAGGP